MALFGSSSNPLKNPGLAHPAHTTPLPNPKAEKIGMAKAAYLAGPHGAANKAAKKKHVALSGLQHAAKPFKAPTTD